MAGIDDPSFVLGKLTGQLQSMEKKVDVMAEDMAAIRKSLNNQKVKQAGLSATVAIVFSFIVAMFKDHFTKG